jgi:hypothetical protein
VESWWHCVVCERDFLLLRHLENVESNTRLGTVVFDMTAAVGRRCRENELIPVWKSSFREAVPPSPLAQV